MAPGLYVLIASAERSSSALTTILVAKDDVNVTIPMLPSFRLLVAAAQLQGEHAKLSAADWRALVEKTAAPPRPPPTKK